MTYENKLQYAGNDPYEIEADRLPHSVFEPMSQDKTYRKLAKVRWLVSELETDLSGDDAVPEDVHDAVFRALEGSRDLSSMNDAVDAYVAAWLDDRAEMLVTDWGIDADLVADACESYGLIGGEVA